MTAETPIDTPGQPPAPSPRSTGLLARGWRWLQIGAVTLFVCWHLFVLAVRNPLDLWYQEIKEWGKEHPWWDKVESSFKRVDRVTWKYANFTGAEQGWSMFTPNLARSAPFLTARIEFTDGSSELVLSRHEPNPTSYLRLYRARERKMEDNLMRADPENLKDEEDLPVLGAYVRWSLRRWRQRAADDPRIPVRVVLLKRRFSFPKPGQDPSHFEPPVEEIIGTFDPEGQLR